MKNIGCVCACAHSTLAFAVNICRRAKQYTVEAGSSGRSTKGPRRASFARAPSPNLISSGEGRGLGLGVLVAAVLELVAQLLEGKDERQRHAEDGRGQPLVRGQQRARRVEYVVVG